MVIETRQQIAVYESLMRCVKCKGKRWWLNSEGWPSCFNCGPPKVNDYDVVSVKSSARWPAWVI